MATPRLVQELFENQSARLCYYVAGDTASGRCIVFLNGFYHGHEAWINQRRNPYLNTYKQIFLDYRGVGGSVLKNKAEYLFDDLVDDIRDIVLPGRYERLILIGYSLGGMMALRFADKYKELACKLVLINTGVRVNYHLKAMLHGIEALLNEGADLRNILLLTYHWNHSLAYLEKLQSMEGDLQESYARYNHDADSFKLLLRAIQKHPDLYETLERISMPALVIGSDGDIIFPLTCQREMISQMPHCEYSVVKGCGHASFIEKPKEVNAAIEKFLKME